MLEGKRLTLSLESAEVRALVAQGQRVLRWGSVPLPGGTLRQGQILQPRVFGEAVAGLLESVKGPRRQTVVGLSAQRSLVRILNLPPVPTRMLQEAVLRQARREFPLPVEGLYLSWQVINDRSASRIQVFTVGLPKEVVDTCMMGLRSARLRPVALDIKPLALVRAINLPNVLVIDLEEGLATIVLVRDFVPHIVRSLPLSQEGTWIDQLIGEIQRTLEFYRTTLSASLPGWSVSLCLTGAGAADEELRRRIAALWPLVEPAPPLSLPRDLPLLPYLGNIGLALKRLP